MSNLRITNIKFADFRNYREFALDDIGNLTVLVGENGVGKTNVLEGIGLLTSCSSFRGAQSAQLIRQGCTQSYLSMKCGDENLQREVDLFIEPGKRKYRVNGKGKGTADVKGSLPSVSFTPDDLELAKKSSGVKRASIDSLGTQLSRNYYIVQRDYEKTLRYKNKLIKEEASRLLVESANDTLLLCGVQLFCFRMSLFNRMIPLASEFYGEISHSKERFSATYTPSWAQPDSGVDFNGFDELDKLPSKEDVRILMSNALESSLEEEMARRRSLVGPHADKISFFLEGKDVSQYASQGQQRSVVLAWKLAEVETVKRSLGTTPVLLLDDVLSELDETRRGKLVSFVTDDIQTFITATDLSGFSDSLVNRAHVLHL